MLKSTHRNNHTVALSYRAAAAEESDHEHDGPDDDEHPRRHRQLWLKFILHHGPVHQKSHPDADYPQAEQLWAKKRLIKANDTQDFA